MEVKEMANLSRYAGSGNFLRKEDVLAPMVLTIANTSEHVFEGKSNPQLVLHWREPGVKPMACNPTNVKLLQTFLNVQDESQLIGRQIEVYVDPTVMMHGQVVGGLRLRLPQGPVFHQQNAAAVQGAFPQPTGGHIPQQQPPVNIQQPLQPGTYAQSQSGYPPNVPKQQQPTADDVPWA
jgi:hypothetical protein